MIYRLGLDVGSTTAKIAVLDTNGALVYNAYRRHNTRVTEVVCTFFDEMREKLGSCRVSAMVTGSAGMGISEAARIPFVQEVVAASRLIFEKYPNVRTLVDLGGEDSKMIFFHPDRQPDIRMNGNCAGGTGAFIDQMAMLLNIPIEELNSLIEPAYTIYAIASRCGVFAKTDVQNLISREVSKSDIVASVFHAVAMQTMNTLARACDVAPKVMFCGGPFSFLPLLKDFFLKAMHLQPNDVVDADHPEIVSAHGAALMEAARLEVDADDLRRRIAEERAATAPRRNALPVLFANDAERERWLLHEKEVEMVKKVPIADYRGARCYVGLDSGYHHQDCDYWRRQGAYLQLLCAQQRQPALRRQERPAGVCR